jgi:aminoglycoside 6'-N-acetyltransferase
VYRWWGGGDDLVAAVEADLADDDVHLTIERGGEVVGWIQWHAEDDADYRHAGVDVYLSTAWHGRGLGTDAVRTLAIHLIDDVGHHRLTIDPAVDNAAAIRAYEKVGFRPVGVMRRYERGPDGTWHDNLLMDLLADELVRDPLTE